MSSSAFCPESPAFGMLSTRPFVPAAPAALFPPDGGDFGDDCGRKTDRNDAADGAGGGGGAKELLDEVGEWFFPRTLLLMLLLPLLVEDRWRRRWAPAMTDVSHQSRARCTVRKMRMWSPSNAPWFFSCADTTLLQPAYTSWQSRLLVRRAMGVKHECTMVASIDGTRVKSSTR